MVSTSATYDRNEAAGCSQFPFQLRCTEYHQQGCMLWTPKTSMQGNDEHDSSSQNQKPSMCMGPNSGDPMSANDSDGDLDSDEGISKLNEQILNKQTHL